jgi:hypothetical protein
MKEWFNELQKPLNVTVFDIMRDFAKFVKDFPVGIIPHQTHEQFQIKHERKRQIVEKNRLSPTKEAKDERAKIRS